MAATAIMTAAEPQLFVSDISASCAFYVGKLGFAIVFTAGDPPFYAQIQRDGAVLNLRDVDGPVFHPDFRAKNPDALSATIPLNDARALFKAFRAAGVPFHQPLRTEPWGARIFIVRDPDGNLIAFAGR